MNKPILAVDWDGVIHSYRSGWKGARVVSDPPNPGALEFLVTALDTFAVAIASSRSHQWGGRRAMKRWLHRNLVELAFPEALTPGWWFGRIGRTAFADPWGDEVAHAADLVIKEIQWPMFKPAAMVMLDDRAVTFNGKFPDLDELRKFQPWWYTKKEPK